MGSTEEPIFLNGSSPSHPLLSKLAYPPPPPLPEPSSDEPPDSDPTQFLQISYAYGPRPFKDLPFIVLFLVLVLCTFGFGVFSIFHRNPNSSIASSFTFDSTSSSCVKPSFSDFYYDPSLRFLAFGSNSGLPFSSSSVLKDLVWTLLITLVLSGPICLGLLLLLKHYTKYLVYASLPFFVVMPIFFNVYWFVACTVSSSCSDGFPLVYRVLVLVFVFLVIGVVVWILVANWGRIELTVNIIGVAADALSKNLGLIGVLPCMTIGLVVYLVPIVVFLVYARVNGKIVPDESSSGVYSCVWKQDSWVPAYYALAIVTMLWSVTSMVEAQVYVTSGTIAQWYFSKEDSKPRRSIRRSLRNAFGPSSGTICLSGLLVCVVRVVRPAVDSARQENGSGMVNFALRCCVNVLLSVVDFLNKFTINFAAITGEAYCTSARMTYELLRRNLLSAVFVETVSTRLLAGIVFVLCAVYTIVVCAILKGVSNIRIDIYVVAALAGALLTVVLGFFVHVLDNVIDTIYVCYAIDKDGGDVCKQDVHGVYVRLPVTRNHRSSPFSSRTMSV